MIKRFSLLLALVLAFSFNVFAAEELYVSAASAILMVADTNEVVFEKNAHQKRSMASTTKIMTALLTAECATPQRVVVTTPEMVNVEGTSMGLKAGDKVTFHDLVYGMLLASGNDAANTAAISIDGSIKTFAQRMNKKAAEIGMTSTNFVTPSGLDDENHYSTAYDMALLGCYAIRNPDFLKACSSVSAKLCYGNEPYTRYLTNHNRLLKSFDGALGIKTGFTKKSGRCLVSAAERDGVMLVCVTLNAPDDWNDHKKMLEYGFERVTVKNIAVRLPALAVTGGDLPQLTLTLSQPLSIATLCSADKLQTQTLVKQSEYAPVEQGEAVGEVRVLLGGKVVADSAVITAQSAECITVPEVDKPTLLQRIKSFFSDIFDSIKGIFKER